MAHIRIGRDGANLTHIDGQVVRYVDEAGRPGDVVLNPDRRYVGTRKLDKAPWLVTLGEDEPVTFEFESYDAAYELLLEPLGEHKLGTFDMT